MRNRFTTRNQWFSETIETIRTSGLILIMSTIRFLKPILLNSGIIGLLRICDRFIYFIHISSLKVYMDQLVNKRKLLSLIYRV